MEISFVKLSPTQNVTVLATSPVPRAEQPAAAAKLLAYDGVGGEQAGFLEKPAHSAARARLQMMGGEFCGNAAMSLGAPEDRIRPADDHPDRWRALRRPALRRARGAGRAADVSARVSLTGETECGQMRAALGFLQCDEINGLRPPFAKN